VTVLVVVGFVLVAAGRVALGSGSDFVTVFVAVPGALVSAVVLPWVAAVVVGGVGLVVETDAPAASVVLVPAWLVAGDDTAADDTCDPLDCFSADTEPEPVVGDAVADCCSVGPLPPCETDSAWALADTDSESELEAAGV
jgi:hypothetical protein